MLKFEHERDNLLKRKGKTIVIDVGPDQMGWTGRNGLADLLEAVGSSIDYVKIWAMNAASLPEPFIRSVVDLYKQAGIATFGGGLLFEYAYLKNDVDGMIELLQHRGIEGVEVSENYLILSRDERLKVIEKLAHASLAVVYEFGRKQPDAPMSVEDLEQVVMEVRESGAHHVILEQSEFDLFDEVDSSATDSLFRQSWFDDVFIEADPFRFPKQHAELIQRFGPTVNLANISPGQVLRVENFRRGLGRSIDFPLIRELAAGRTIG